MIHKSAKPLLIRVVLSGLFGPLGLAFIGLVFFAGHPLTQAQEVVSTEQAQQQNETIQLWPNGLPADSVELPADKIAKLKKREANDPNGHKLYVDSPTLTVYQAPEKLATGCAVVICPGGAYNVLAWEKEGLEIAEWFNTIGVSAFVLEYRVPRRIPDKIHWEPMQDVQRAIRLVRHQAKQHEIDPERIGVLGFSAGGHLTIMAGTHYDTECYEPQDAVDQQSARPNFLCPIYASYLGDGYTEDKAELGSLVDVTSDTPPAFLAATWDDKFRGAQSALLFARFKEHGVPAEFHGYTKGGHGYGIRESKHAVSKWHLQLEQWLKSSGFTNTESKK